MPLFGSFRIGRWFGFPIRIDFSWFPIAALVIWTFTTREFPRALPFYPSSTYLAMGTAAALLFFLSVLLHELGHALAGRARGVEVEHITLFIFGGIAQARDEARRPLDEFLLTAAGPLASVALAAAFHGGRVAAEAWAAPAPVVTVLGFLALLNFVLAVFNMIPGFPLDGGRIFRSIVWAVTGDLVKATRWATQGGRLFGGALIVLGLLNLSRGQFISGVWAAFIGWFVVNAASSSLRHFELRTLLRRIPVGTVMNPRPHMIEAGMPVERAISDYFLRGREEAYPVERDGSLIGVVEAGGRLRGAGTRSRDDARIGGRATRRGVPFGPSRRIPGGSPVPDSSPGVVPARDRKRVRRRRARPAGGRRESAAAAAHGARVAGGRCPGARLRRGSSAAAREERLNPCPGPVPGRPVRSWPRRCRRNSPPSIRTSPSRWTGRRRSS